VAGLAQLGKLWDANGGDIFEQKNRVIEHN